MLYGTKLTKSPQLVSGSFMADIQKPSLLQAPPSQWLRMTEAKRPFPVSSRWQMEWENVEAVTEFLFLGSKNIADGDCSHEIRRLLLGRKAMTNLNRVLTSRDITLLTKVHIVEAMVFPVLMYGCESQTIKKAERQRIDAFKLWCWRRLLRVLWTAKRSN